MSILLLIAVLASVFFLNRIIFTLMRGESDSLFAITLLSVFLLLLVLLVMVTKSVLLTITCIVLSVCVVVIDRLFFIPRYAVYQLGKYLVIDHCLVGSLLLIGYLSL